MDSIGFSNTDDLLRRTLAHAWMPTAQMKSYEDFPPLAVESAKGAWLYTPDGEKVLDVISSWWCNLFGHRNERIDAAAKAQLERMAHVIFADVAPPPAAELCEKLLAVAPEGLAHILFADNGSSAVEIALKLSLQYHYQTGDPERTEFMSLTGAYHGETVGALSLGDIDRYTSIFKPLLAKGAHKVEAPFCYRCPYGEKRETCNAPCFEHAEKAFAIHGKKTCAFFIEPMMQGAAGFRFYSPIYLKKLRELCDEYGVLLVADEIAAGFGRTGKMFACEHAGISPDIMCVSKGLTNGYMPMALTLTSEKIFQAFYAEPAENKQFEHSHTYSGNPLACAIACEVLNIFKDENVIENLAKKAAVFSEIVAEEFAGLPYVGEIRGMGLINAIELTKDKEARTPLANDSSLTREIYHRAVKKGLLLRPIGESIIYFNPPYIINEEEMRFAASTAADCVREVLSE